jgi:hypothetical protein
MKLGFPTWKKYATFEEMPNALLAFLGALSFVQVSLLTRLLFPMGSAYMDAMETAGLWHWEALVIGVVLAVFGAAWFMFGGVSARCSKLLSDRWCK